MRATVALWTWPLYATDTAGSYMLLEPAVRTTCGYISTFRSLSCFVHDYCASVDIRNVYSQSQIAHSYKRPCPCSS